jgi:pimeloyl-ACP methyl ester carboxylesterase
MLHIDQHGTGLPIVLLHGTPTPPRHLAPLAGALGDRACTLVVHLPGYGQSAPLDGAFDVARIAEAVESALLARDVREAAFVGFSGGVYHAASIAARGRVRARSLVALAGAGSFSATARATYRQFAQMLRGGVDARPLMGPRMLSDAYRARHPEAVAEVESWIDATSVEVLAGELAAFADAPDRVDGPCPVHARLGAMDVASERAEVERLVGATGTLEVVPNVGHALLIEDEAATFAFVRRALLE